MNHHAAPGRCLATALLLLVAACGGGGSGSGAGGSAPPDETGGTLPPDGGATISAISLEVAGIGGVTADTFTLVSSARVGRTSFDYTYTVRITNNSGTALAGATATVSSAAPTTIVTDDSLSFGDVAVGASAVSTDTFTIRQDRTAPVATAKLTVTLDATPVLPKSSAQLIGEALASGDIDAETALVYKVYAVFGDARLPAQYQGDDSAVLDSMVMGEVADRLATLSPANRAILEPFTIPPVYEGSWWQQREATAGVPTIQAAGRAKPLAIPCPGCPDTLWSNTSQAGGHVKVWWRTSELADEAHANQILNAVEGKIWPELTTLMGREPLSDLLLDRNGGDGLLDIYVLRFTGNTIGLTVAYPFGCKERPTYVGIDPSHTSHLLAAVAHELMHTIQFSYRVAQACSDYDWLGEATATWAMDFVYPADNYEHKWASDYLTRPETGLSKGADYGAYLFPFYLARRQVPSVVSIIWNNTTQYDSLEAIEQSIPGGFKEQWPEFTLYNWNRDEVHYYKDWDNLVYVGDLANMPWRVPKWNGAEPAVLAGVPDKKAPFTRLKSDGQENLSANYYHWVFNDDSVRTAIFYNGFTWEVNEETEPDLGTRLVPHDWTDPRREKAKVKALVKIGGKWQPQPEDWTDRPQQYFCRDRKSERIEELVLIFSNAEHRVQPPGNGRLFPPDEPPTLWLSNMGCHEWKGFTHFERREDGVTETVHGTVTWTPTLSGTYFEATGTLAWSISGTDSGGCSHSGSATVPIEASPFFMRYLLTFNDYNAGNFHRAYEGFGFSEETVRETVVCPDDSGGTTTSQEDRWAGYWFPGQEAIANKVGAQGDAINGAFIDISAGESRWDWHFEAQRE